MIKHCFAELAKCGLLLQMEQSGLLVCNDHEPCKNGWTDQDAIWNVDLVGTNSYVLDGVQIPHEKGDKIFPHATKHRSQWPWRRNFPPRCWLAFRLVGHGSRRHIKFPQWKIPPCKVASCQNFLTTCYHYYVHASLITAPAVVSTTHCSYFRYIHTYYHQAVYNMEVCKHCKVHY